jgi:hypothetical protein
MALYRIDGWDYWYNSNGANNTTQVKANADADGWYEDISQLKTITGRFGKGLALGLSGASFSTGPVESVGKRFQSGETCVIGQALFTSEGTTSWWGFGIVDAQGIGSASGYNNRHFWLNFEVNGIIRLYLGGSSTTNPSGSTLVATTAAKVLHYGEWDYVEVKFKLHATAGIIEVRVNTVVVLSYVGRTANQFTPLLGLPVGWDGLQYAGTSATPNISFDDRYILDDTGTTNLTYLGNVRVNCQLPTAAGDLTEMGVFGAASNWDAVNEPELTETEYVFTPTMGQRDLYTLNPNVTAQNVLGVQITGAHRQDDSTQLKSELLLKTGGTLYTGPDNFLAQNYRYYHNMYDLNPNTGVGWTAANLNALQAGQKVLLA